MDDTGELLFERFEGVRLHPWKNHRRTKDTIVGPVVNMDKYPVFMRHHAFKNVWGTEPKQVEDENYRHLDEPCLYGGMIDFRHFGHLAAEYVHRLWVLSRLNETRKVIFVGLDRADTLPIPEVFHEMMAYLGVENWEILFEPVVVADLIVGAQGKLAGRQQKAGYGNYLAQCERRLTIDAADNLPDKVAVLRSHRDGEVGGRLVGEKCLESALQEEGYIAFRPEEHPLEHQLKILKNAKKIIISEGSAIHLFDLIATTTADVAVINRRPYSKLARASLTNKVKSLNVYSDVNFVLHRNKDKKSDPNRSLTYSPLAKIFAFFRDQKFIRQSPDIQSTAYEDVLKYLQLNDAQFEDAASEPDWVVERLLGVISKKIGANKQLRAENMVLSARLHIASNDPGAAKELLDQVLKLNPGNAVASEILEELGA